MAKLGRLQGTPFTWHEVDWRLLKSGESGAAEERARIFDFKNKEAKDKADAIYKKDFAKNEENNSEALRRFKISGLAHANAKITAYLFVCFVQFSWLVLSTVYTQTCSSTDDTSYCSTMLVPTVLCHITIYVNVYLGVHKKKQAFVKSKELMYVVNDRQ